MRLARIRVKRSRDRSPGRAIGSAQRSSATGAVDNKKTSIHGNRPAHESAARVFDESPCRTILTSGATGGSFGPPVSSSEPGSEKSTGGSEPPPVAPEKTQVTVPRRPAAHPQSARSGATGGSFGPPVSSSEHGSEKEHWRLRAAASGTRKNASHRPTPSSSTSTICTLRCHWQELWPASVFIRARK